VWSATRRNTLTSVNTPPSLAEQKRNRLLEMGVGGLILALWAFMAATDRLGLPESGCGRWFLLSIGPTTVVQICYAAWKYLQLTRQHDDG
jgi:hypothetical protein